MNTNNKTNRKVKLTCIALLFMGSLTASAQIDLPGNGDGQVIDAPAAPIDGFLSVALLAGAAIGLRKHLKGSKQ